MSRNWLRKVLVTTEGGGTTIFQGGGPTDLRIRFETISGTGQSLALANIIVTNPSRSRVASVGSEFTKLELYAGYQDRTPLLFSGSVTETRYGQKENGFTDTLLQIWLADGDRAYQQGRVSKTLAAGSTPQDIVDHCLQAFQPFGISMGKVVGVDLSQPRFPRGYVLFGMARDIMREVALSKRATWNINGSKLNVIGKGFQSSGNTVVLNANTGMIGQPVQTLQGIEVRCLLGTGIQVDDVVQIDQADIVRSQYTDANVQLGDANNQINLANQGVDDGQYRVLQIKTIADTRGNPYYADLTTIGVTGKLNTVQSGMGLS